MGGEKMKKGFVAILLAGVVFGTDYEAIKTAYLTGWFDAFRIAYYMKNAKKVRVPSGWWVVYPIKNLPVEYVGFYVFAGLREGVKPILTKDYIVFGVFDRKADAEFLAKKLRTKDVEAEVKKESAQDGYLGFDFRSVHVEPRFGVDGVLYHIRKAIEKAQDIDPTVLNRDLLVKDLKAIERELEKWKSGRKGYTPAVAKEAERDTIIERFLEEKSEETVEKELIRKFLEGK